MEEQDNVKDEDLIEPAPSSNSKSNDKSSNGGLKTWTIILAIVAAVLAVVLAFVWRQHSSLIKDLKIEKENLIEQMNALQNDYESLSSDYESINSQLDSSREEVAQLIERIKSTEATNRAKIRQYEKELGTLRSIMKNYIVQIDSLNTLNQRLTADAAAARREAAESRRKNEALNREVESLAGKVATGSVLKGIGLSLMAYNGSDKITDRSSRVVRLMASITLVENDLAPRGPVRVYIQVKDPDGVLLTNSNSVEFTCNGVPMIASASREVDYQGDSVDMNIYLNDIPDYSKGAYSLEAFTTKGSLGSAELVLR